MEYCMNRSIMSEAWHYIRMIIKTLWKLFFLLIRNLGISDTIMKLWWIAFALEDNLNPWSYNWRCGQYNFSRLSFKHPTLDMDFETKRLWQHLLSNTKIGFKTHFGIATIIGFILLYTRLWFRKRCNIPDYTCITMLALHDHTCLLVGYSSLYHSG